MEERAEGVSLALKASPQMESGDSQARGSHRSPAPPAQPRHPLHLPSIRCIPLVNSLWRIPSFVPLTNIELLRRSILVLEMQPGAR